MSLFGPCGCCHGGCQGRFLAEVTPNVKVNGFTTFGAHPPGRYCFQYGRGAFVYQQAGDGNRWAASISPFELHFGNQKITVPVFAFFTSQAAVEASVHYARNFDHPGGEIRVFFADVNLADNLPGDPSPTWKLFELD